jgi:hypothetical protein
MKRSRAEFDAAARLLATSNAGGADLQLRAAQEGQVASILKDMLATASAATAARTASTAPRHEPTFYGGRGGRGGFSAAAVSEKEVETDEHTVKKRQEQLDLGKNTIGYMRYCLLVPRERRNGREQPRTPDPRERMSKRRWDAVIRSWRRQLHFYDLHCPPPSDRGSSYGSRGGFAGGRGGGRGGHSGSGPPAAAGAEGGADDEDGGATTEAALDQRPDGSYVAQEMPPAGRDFFVSMYGRFAPLALGPPALSGSAAAASSAGAGTGSARSLSASASTAPAQAAAARALESARAGPPLQLLSGEAVDALIESYSDGAPQARMDGGGGGGCGGDGRVQFSAEGRR